jgi:hypothetical protein
VEAAVPARWLDGPLPPTAAAGTAARRRRPEDPSDLDALLDAARAAWERLTHSPRRLALAAAIAVVLLGVLMLVIALRPAHLPGTYANERQIGLRITFGDDGTFAWERPGQPEVRGSYRLDGGRVTLRPSSPSGGVAPPVTGSLAAGGRSVTLLGAVYARVEP